LRARGGFTFDIEWDSYLATKIIINSKVGEKCRLRLNKVLVTKVLCNGKEVNFSRNDDTIEFTTISNNIYEIKINNLKVR